MAFRCGCILSIRDNDPNVRFAGGLEHVPQPGARLFPLTRIKNRAPAWVELQCTRTDEHPLNGSHWYETPGGYRMTWDVPGDTIWLA